MFTGRVQAEPFSAAARTNIADTAEQGEEIKILFSYLRSTRVQGIHIDSRINNEHTPKK